MARLQSFIGPMKSCMSCDMQPEHRLSTPIGPESVSNLVTRSLLAISVACMATAAIAIPINTLYGDLGIVRPLLVRTLEILSVRLLFRLLSQ